MLVTWFIALGVQAAPLEVAERCRAETAQDLPIRQNDFKWNYALNELLERAKEIYTGERRLSRRMYWDPARKSFVLPYEISQGGDVIVPESFVTSVRRHVEEALRLKYVDAVFFPDMGHSHFMLPKAKYDSDYVTQPSQSGRAIYERFFADPELKVLYHTAEQLALIDANKKVLPDRHTQWRFYSRNLVGDNRQEGRLELHQEPGHVNNTFGGLNGYQYWGSGFNISAHRDGCVAYRDANETKYFDLSLYDLPYEGNDESMSGPKMAEMQ